MNKVKRNLYTLHIRLLENRLMRKVTTYNVTENFKKGECRYQVQNLNFENGDETVFFYDSEEKILTNPYTLAGILVEDILNIDLSESDLLKATIHFSDGTIQIRME